MTERNDGYLSKRYRRGLDRRRRRERLLRGLGLGAIATAVGMLVILFSTIVLQSRTALWQTQIAVPVYFDPSVFHGFEHAGQLDLADANHQILVRRGLEELIGKQSDRAGRRSLMALMSSHSGDRVRDALLDDPELLGSRRVFWLPASDDVDMVVKGVTPREVAEHDRQIDDRQLAWIDRLDAGGSLRLAFNRDFFTNSASRDPEVAGIRGAVTGSFFMLMVTLLVALPIGVGAAIYLEEFAPKNRLTEMIDVNIRNLAAIPSIVFGLLGLAFFIEILGLPRSTPLVGGLVLALMTLPTIVIASRAAIHSVPPSLYEAALQLGASRMQAMSLTVLPTALPGILTGMIIGMAQALGETAPLLMVGMVAFIADPPATILDSAAPLPVQIFLWATSAERAFGEKTAAAIVVLLIFLVAMNGLTIYLRRRFERSW